MHENLAENDRILKGPGEIKSREVACRDDPGRNHPVLDLEIERAKSDEEVRKRRDKPLRETSRGICKGVKVGKPRKNRGLVARGPGAQNKKGERRQEWRRT